MKTNAERMQRVMVWLGAACLRLMPMGPLSAQEPKIRGTLKGHTDDVFSVAYSPDGKTLASGSRDQTIKLWDVGAAKKWAILKGHTSIVYFVAYCPAGKTLASGGRDKTIKLWDIPAAKEDDK